MCNLYSITKGQAAIIAFTRAKRDLTGSLPPMPERRARNTSSPWANFFLKWMGPI
jgi:hypothetical protein